MMGAVLTFFLFELVIGVRNEKKNLIIQLRSQDNATALSALEQIKENGWHEDLKGANLWGANLQGVYLTQANLKGANLVEANLKETSLYEANLQGAKLWGANLQGANLRGANLQGADLWVANLQGATLSGVKFDEKTVLPDSKYNDDKNIYTKYWTPETDMSRYTDPNHPDFWQPEWVKRQSEENEE